jgi:hypothetical protein
MNAIQRAIQEATVDENLLTGFTTEELETLAQEHDVMPDAIDETEEDLRSLIINNLINKQASPRRY